MGFSLGIFPILAVLGVFKLRIKGMSKLKLPGFPFVHIFFILVSMGILVLSFFERPQESTIAILTALPEFPFSTGSKGKTADYCISEIISFSIPFICSRVFA